MIEFKNGLSLYKLHGRYGSGIILGARDFKILINDDNDENAEFSNRVSGDDKKHRLQIAKSHENGMAWVKERPARGLKVKGGRDGRRASSY